MEKENFYEFDWTKFKSNLLELILQFQQKSSQRLIGQERQERRYTIFYTKFSLHFKQYSHKNRHQLICD